MLVTILADRNTSTMVRVWAAKLILNLAYGRPRADRVTCAAPQRPLYHGTRKTTSDAVGQ